MWVRNGDTTSHCLWQYTAEMHHLQYGPVTMFQLYWYTKLLVCLSAGVGCTVNTPCDFTIPYNSMYGADTHIHSTDICPCTPLTKILWITANVSLFSYWYVWHSLPACWQHSVPTHNRCHQYTCSTTDSSDLPINFSRLTPFYSKKLNTTFWSNLDSFTPGTLPLSRILLLFTQSPVLSCTSVCQCVYQVKGADAPSTLPEQNHK